MSRRVLIVEDEYIVAADLEAKLADMGYDVTGLAASGEEALSIADQKRPDIVLIDIRLQGRMSGREAAQLIQRKTGAVVVFITAFAVLRENRDEKSRDGIYLSKPFSTAQLKVALESAVAARAET